MAMKPSNNIWIRRQQCPCGDWKCYIKYEGDDQTSANSQLVKSETSSSSLASEVVFTPYVGQIFKSDDEAFEYYSNFARKNGFSIRKARSTESQNLGIYRRDFVCYRSGFNQPRKKANVEHPRDRKSVRCGCDAKLYLTKEIVDGVTQWYVSQFSNVHNHELLEDDQVRLLPAYRKIQEADQERILLLSKAGFPVNRIVRVLETEKGVQPGQLPFIEKDVRNFVRTCKKTVQENDALLTEKRENDTLELLETCKALSERDPDFVYDFTMDPNDKVENIAWSYGNSVHAYSVLIIMARQSSLDVFCCKTKLLSHCMGFTASWPFSCIRGYFLARMMTSEYSKSLDMFFKRILSAQTCLQAFFEQVGVAASWANQTRENMQYMHIKTCMPIEEHAQSILTPYAFNVLQHEIVLSMQYATREMANGSYLVRHYKTVDGDVL
ncbi:putative protein FAR1-related sequence 10 [Vitis vinifera]|uniref:Protein FAR1-RELATED SEQUENCE n=1 Tax=Vitis vinifera TaxID=29760 RepID=A0A438DQ90_VITVI|nr:putative protein FAR1-related sequence 10 [Vitis vinifera]